ncbi:MAG: rhomboid family intramembrane serine protease [Deltaproteobacteria bacterium]|nr:rhomboid family intramembrane serine protease [Deltaproteobacteria bacterium]
MTPATWAVAAASCGALVFVWLAVLGARPTVQTLVTAGAKVDALVADGEWWRLVVAGALHASPVHLALNCALLAFALLAWSRLGRARGDDGWARPLAGLGLAVIGSAGGFVASFLVRAGASVGASAAVHGLLAAIVAAVWLGRAALPERARLVGPIALSLSFVAVLGASFAVTGLDHAAHVGGAITGLALAPLVDRSGRARVVVGGAALALVLAGMIGGSTASS